MPWIRSGGTSSSTPASRASAALSRTETGDLLLRVLGGQVEELSSSRLWEATEGNALLLREVVIHARRRQPHRQRRRSDAFDADDTQGCGFGRYATATGDFSFFGCDAVLLKA